MEREPIGNPIEAQQPLTFREVVETTQRRWRDNKRNGLKSLTQFSQAIDLPEEITGNWMSTIIDCLPGYFSQDLRDHLRETHPNPIYTTSLLKDKRLKVTNPDFTFAPSIPMPEQDLERWLEGGGLVEEAVIQDLQGEILVNMAKRNKVFSVTKKVSDLLNRIEGGESGNLKKELGGDEKYSKAGPEITKSLFSGDVQFFNEYLRETGYGDINDFFRIVSKYELISSGPHKAFNELTKGATGKFLRPLLTGGSMSGNKPGILNISALLPSLIPLEIADTVLNLSYSTTNVPSLVVLASLVPIVIVHETCHYLARNIDHEGFNVEKITRKSA